ncbi:hypothetical protein E2C01_060094 [Portunus trituberculatus]|uniref:Uncharacterized protein n=1 Tax=Portunus trituberculatus TaxID=210409 RepID=A0A5B7HB35_PORTR|nr:hypothetical protein [Portunus trituberculatus]
MDMDEEEEWAPRAPWTLDQIQADLAALAEKLIRLKDIWLSTQVGSVGEGGRHDPTSSLVVYTATTIKLSISLQTSHLTDITKVFNEMHAWPVTRQDFSFSGLNYQFFLNYRATYQKGFSGHFETLDKGCTLSCWH